MAKISNNYSKMLIIFKYDYYYILFEKSRDSFFYFDQENKIVQNKK